MNVSSFVNITMLVGAAISAYTIAGTSGAVCAVCSLLFIGASGTR